jgi:hypothetical protein
MRYTKPYLLLRGDRNAEAFRDFSGLRVSILSYEEDEQPPAGVEPSDQLGLYSKRGELHGCEIQLVGRRRAVLINGSQQV